MAGLASGVANLSAGERHTCVVTSAGGAKCWGSNGSGETTGVPVTGAGFTTISSRLAPVDVPGLEAGVASISAGGGHTCAVTTSGAAKCWGSNYYGELGTGSATSYPWMISDVAGLSSGVVSIQTDTSMSCALTTSGMLKCWGQNNLGQLGDGSQTTRRQPITALGLGAGVVDFNTRGYPKCAKMASGGLKCWPMSTADRRPVDFTGFPAGVQSFTGSGAHLCAVMSDNGVKCWGRNNGESPMGNNGTLSPTGTTHTVDVWE